MKRNLLILFLIGGFSTAEGQDLVSLWSVHAADGRAFQCCIEKDRIPNLRIIDILSENPRLSLKDASITALKEAKKRNPKAKTADLQIESITFDSRSIGSIEFSFYEIEILLKRDGAELGREWVSVLFDGKVLQRIPIQKWREIEAKTAGHK